METKRSLWSSAGLTQIETRQIDVERTFADFDSFWQIAQTGPRLATSLAAMPEDDRQLLKERLRARLSADAAGRITYGARANAIRGWLRHSPRRLSLRNVAPIAVATCRIHGRRRQGQVPKVDRSFARKDTKVWFRQPPTFDRTRANGG